MLGFPVNIKRPLIAIAGTPLIPYCSALAKSAGSLKINLFEPKNFEGLPLIDIYSTRIISCRPNQLYRLTPQGKPTNKMTKIISKTTPKIFPT